MPNICPYEARPNEGFKEINFNNLAYELVFKEGYNVDTLKNAGLNIEGFLDGIDSSWKDARLVQFYNDSSIHYILPERGLDRAENGMDNLKRQVDEMNSKVEEEVASGLFKTGIFVLEEDENGVYQLEFGEASGEMQNIIASIYPACPSCHKRLPLGFTKADYHLTIALLGGVSSGKTTFVSSLISNKFSALRGLGKDWRVFEINTGSSYQTLKETSIKLVNNGECPDPTRKEFLIEPLFLGLKFKNSQEEDKSIIIQIIDNSGERVTDMDPDDSRMAMILHSDCSIYLIEPEQLKLNLDLGEEEGLRVKLASPEENDAEGNEGVTFARDLVAPVAGNNNSNVLNMYYSMVDMFERYDMQDKLDRHHIAFTVVKSDMFKEAPQIDEEPGMRDALFNNIPAKVMLGMGYELIRKESLTPFFEKYVFNEAEMSVVEEEIGSYSFHVISSLGCDTVERNKVKVLTGPLNPILIADPIITLIKKKISQ